jgi:hypothetical protein
MNKEQIESLVELIGEHHAPFSNLELMKETLTEWFEQNKVEPIVVVLSDSQIKALGKVIHQKSIKKHKDENFQRVGGSE